MGLLEIIKKKANRTINSKTISFYIQFLKVPRRMNRNSGRSSKVIKKIDMTEVRVARDDNVWSFSKF